MKGVYSSQTSMSFLWSFSISSFGLALGWALIFRNIIRCSMVVLAIPGLVGCIAKQERPRLVFDIGMLKQAEWNQASKTCEYEVAKAVAPIKIGIIATEQYRKLYILCAEAKGAVFIGSTDKVRMSAPNIVEVQPYYWN